MKYLKNSSPSIKFCIADKSDVPLTPNFYEDVKLYRTSETSFDRFLYSRFQAMTQQERIKYAEERIKELKLLIHCWKKCPK